MIVSTRIWNWPTALSNSWRLSLTICRSATAGDRVDDKRLLHGLYACALRSGLFWLTSPNRKHKHSLSIYTLKYCSFIYCSSSIPACVDVALWMWALSSWFFFLDVVLIFTFFSLCLPGIHFLYYPATHSETKPEHVATQHQRHR